MPQSVEQQLNEKLSMKIRLFKLIINVGKQSQKYPSSKYIISLAKIKGSK